jgi:hypothetical protein
MEDEDPDEIAEEGKKKEACQQQDYLHAKPDGNVSDKINNFEPG